MQEQYHGRVRVRHGAYGFINSRTVVNLEPEGPKLETDKGIFYLLKDFPEATVDGALVKFTVTPDQRRPGCFRAEPIRQVAIELHFPERVLDHPTASVRWCLSPAARQLIASTADTSWYLAIVAQPQRKKGEQYFRDKPGTGLTTLVGLKAIGDGHGYIDFKRSGPHDVVAYLVASDNSIEVLRKHLARFDKIDGIDVWGSREKEILATDSTNLLFLGRSFSRNDRVCGLAHVTLDVPPEIFAKPLSPRLKSWLGYFSNEKLRDECDMRGKIIFACTAGPILFLCWEFLKRFWMLVLGVLHFTLAGGNPRPLWGEAMRRQLSASISNWRGSEEYEPLTGWTDTKTKIWYHPLPWTGLLILLTLLFSVPPSERGWPITILTIFIILVCLIFVATIFGDGITNLFEQFGRQRQQKEMQDVLYRIGTYASCDTTRKPVAPPPTVRLVWSGIKRRVCRTYIQ